MNKLHAAFFNNAEIHFMLFDKELRIIDVNDATLSFYHLAKENLIGKHILEVAPDVKGKGLYEKYREVIETGKSVIIEDSISHPKFGNHHNRIKAFKVGDGMGAAAINITELKTTIASLEFFILQSSHDLGSPIASIEGLASLALLKDNTSDEIIKYCEIIKEQAQRTKETIQKLVETIRIKNETEEKQLIHFSPLINEIIASLQYVAGFSEMEITYEIITDKRFYSEKRSLISLFQNLIDNAIKYRRLSDKKSFLKIIVADDVLGIKIMVSDNGIGIPFDLQRNVFKMFFKASNRKDSTGLGLYTISQIVNKIGGHITFISKEGSGTSFSIFLPVIEKEVLVEHN